MAILNGSDNKFQTEQLQVGVKKKVVIESNEKLPSEATRVLLLILVGGGGGGGGENGGSFSDTTAVSGMLGRVANNGDMCTIRTQQCK